MRIGHLPRYCPSKYDYCENNETLSELSLYTDLEKWLNDENVKKEIEEVDEKSCMHHRKLRQEVDPDYDKVICR